ncbi:AfsA-related hotdog domain-containing protein [Xenorhabdus sp. SGI240]|uniref:AfsA-related hotdog domain-containing protein n=1 Tax=Xenorhabdus sp. SGI240 TaxID=3158262 RepID=UPI0032B74E59
MEQLAITPYILHKDHEDDVLLMSFKPILPTYIKESIISEFIKTASNDEINDFFSVYIKEGGVYVLKHISFCLSKKSMEELIENKKINFKDFYVLQDEKWILKNKYLPKIAFNNLRELIDNKEHSISNELVDKIGYSLSKYGEMPVSRANRYIIKNDTEHYFFYRKEHEHVPGLMLIEMSRQAMYHYVYSYSGYSRGDVSITISSLEVDFCAFTESSYELEVIVSTTSDIAHTCPRHIDLISSFYQNGNLVARVRLKGGVLKLNVFKRMRTLNFPKDHWFKLFSRTNRLVMLMGDTEKINIVDIDAISTSGIRLITNSPITSDIKWVIIQANKKNILKLPIEEITFDKLNNVMLANFSILDRYHEQKLSEFIKLNCYFFQKKYTKDQLLSNKLFSHI